MPVYYSDNELRKIHRATRYAKITGHLNLSPSQKIGKDTVKFGHSEKVTKFEIISHLIYHLLSKRQITWKIV